MNKSKLSVFKKIPTVTTPRLIMRKMLPSDSEDMFEYAKNPAVTRYLLWEEHVNKKFTHSYLKFIQSQYAAGNFYDWALTLAESGKMIGTCGFSSFDESNNAAEVGYVLSPDYWRQGIATEALFRVMRFGFEKLGLNRIEAKFIEGNSSSRRVMEKTGMTFEGYQRKAMLIKGEYKTIGICSILREEFESEDK